jgi:sulfoxide reductase heme-binding subunit YedZ
VRDPTQYVWWLTSRAAGVTAFALASAAVMAGLMMAGKIAAKPGRARVLKAVHEHAAVGALIAVAVHGLALLGDHWLNPGLTGLVVPFSMGYRPLATGLGVIAGYGMALLGLTFYARRRIGPRLWRKAHRLTIVFWALAAVHAITAGSDVTTPWMRGILGATVAPIVVLFLARVTPRHERTLA